MILKNNFLQYSSDINELCVLDLFTHILCKHVPKIQVKMKFLSLKPNYSWIMNNYGN